ncbi:MAG: response regulator [Deltaproteobacteria bacterium]|nr:response regulator [Deltaproteobacteria bacterium]
MLVDDETDFLEALVKRLTKRKLNVTAASGGPQALQMLAEQPVDVIVLDVKMPQMDGMQALREIKKIQPSAEVIMLTGHADLEAAIQGMELGAFDYLMKPADIDELLYKIQDAYKKKKTKNAAGL